MGNKRIYLGREVSKYAEIAGGAIITITSLFFVLMVLGVEITGSDDFCLGTPENPCVSYGKICNLGPNNYDIYNPEGIDLDFSPMIKDYWIFFKDGRVKKEVLEPLGIEHSTAGWRYENFTDATKPRSDRVYVHRFAAYNCQNYMLVGLKENPDDLIKWGFGVGKEYLDPFWYAINDTPTNLITNLSIELGTQINITANISGESYVEVDIDHPDYGINYSQGSPSANFLFNISYFRLDEFNDSATFKNISYNGPQNQTIHIKSHQYDEIINVSFNITGYLNNGTYPASVKVYINDSLSNNLGAVVGGGETTTLTFDDENITFGDDLNDTVYYLIPKSATISEAYFTPYGNSADADIGNGSDGTFSFTAGSLNPGNLVYTTDYTNTSTILYLKTNRVYNFINFTLGNGMTLSTLSATGAALLIKANDTVNLTGNVVLQSSTYGTSASSWTPFAGLTLTNPGVGAGGKGGYLTGGGYGSQGDGFGGGGEGGYAGCTDGSQSYGSDGGNGGSDSDTGGAGAQADCTPGSPSFTGPVNALDGGGAGGGGGAGVYCQSGTTSASATGGIGGSSWGSNGADGAGSKSGSGGCWSAGGGGGAGGKAGKPGYHFYTYSNVLYASGTITTNGSAATDGGDGGRRTYYGGYSYDGGRAGGGGGGGSAGNIVLSYKTSATDTSTKVMGGGAAGVKGIMYTVSTPGVDSKATDGTAGTSGTNETSEIKAYIQNPELEIGSIDGVLEWESVGDLIGNNLSVLWNGTDILKYARTDSDYPNTNYPNSIGCSYYGAVSDEARTHWCFNNPLYTDVVLKTANYSLTAGYWGTTGTGYSVFQIYIDWKNSSGSNYLGLTDITSNNQPCGRSFDNSTNCNLTTEYEFIVGAGYSGPMTWPVKNMLQKTLDDENGQLCFTIRPTTNPDETILESASNQRLEVEYSGKSNNFADAISNYLLTCTADADGYCRVPFIFSATAPGTMIVQNLTIKTTSDLNPVYLDVNLISAYLGNSTGFVDIPIKIENSQNGTIYIDDLRFDHRGGNDTIEIKVHNSSYTTNETFNVNLFYSDFYKNLPYTWNDNVFFLPMSYNESGVKAYGQSDTKPIYNITNTNYGGKNLDMFFNLNGSSDCIDIFASTNNTKPTSSLWDGLVSYWSFDIDARDNEGSNDGIVSGATLVSGDDQDGLTHWYKFDAEGDLQDYAGTNDATNYGANWTSAGKYSGAYDFDGVDDLIGSGAGIYTTGDYDNTNTSFSIWVNVKTQPTGIFGRIIETEGCTGSYPLVLRLNDERILNIAIYNGTDNPSMSSDFALPENEWHHIFVSSYSNNVGKMTIDFYYDGVFNETSEQDMSGKICNNPIDSRISIGNTEGQNRGWNGTIDDVRIYNASLSSSQITALYERRLETIGNTYKFDGSSDKIIIPNNTNLRIDENISIAAWFKLNQDNQLNTIIHVGAPDSLLDGEYRGYWLGIDNRTSTKIWWQIGNSSDVRNTLNPTVSYGWNTWHHIVAIYNTSGQFLYIDGVIESSSDAYAGPIIYTNITVTNSDIGLLSSYKMNGSIDEVRVYNKSLTSSEISEIYNRSRLKYYDVKLTDEFNLFSYNRPYLFNEKIWMWADLNNCNASVNRFLTPNLEIKSNCKDCIWGN